MHHVGTTSVTPHAWSSWTYLAANRCSVCNWFRKKSWKSLTRFNKHHAKMWESRIETHPSFVKKNSHGDLSGSPLASETKKTPALSLGPQAGVNSHRMERPWWRSWTCLTKARKAVQGQSEWLENVPMLNEPYRLTIWLFNIAMENHHL